MDIQTQVRLANYTSWQIGGPAEYFCTPKNLEEIKEAISEAKRNSWPLTILGGGSNVLVSDQGIDGLVVCLKNFTGVTTTIENKNLIIEAFSGTSKSELLKIFLKNKLAPALFLAGLPGDVGGGVVMNAGVSEAMQPREFGELVEWLEVLRLDTLKVDRISQKDLQWSYRHSTGWQPGLVVKVRMKWPVEAQDNILAHVKAANLSRLSKQPLDLPSCGSVFVNPPGHKAAALIQECGLKGYRIGDAQVSLKHSNFIVNLGSATAVDTLQVISDVKAKVLAEKNIQLKTEVVFLGKKFQK